MIISASRRTDIPAFYSDWLFNRLKEEFVYVRNPMNIHQISKIVLSSDVVDCIVFWTKNPADMLTRHRADLQNLQIPFYFQFTVNSYNKLIEPNVPEKKLVFDTFAELSSLCGKERVIWRYDPIIITETLSADYHCKYFEYIAKKLAPYTNKCVMSFVDMYKKTQKNMSGIPCEALTFEGQIELSKRLLQIANTYGLELVTCAEQIDLTNIGIAHGKCVDPELIAHLCGGTVMLRKDKNQRPECGCVDSIDIGAYNTCLHGCKYCYANFSQNVVERQSKAHNPLSPLITGEVLPEDRIVVRDVKSVIDKQAFLFDKGDFV